MRFQALLVFTLPCLLLNTPVQANDFFQEADRVVLLGNTLIEREQEYGHWEALLTQGAAEKKLTFRNLGWSADTVWAESRGMFDPPAKGYERMLELIHELKPTVIILGYGNVEAFDGLDRLPAFEQQYRKLLTDLKPLQARFVFVSPVKMEFSKFPEQTPEAQKFVADYNAMVDVYSNAIRTLADENGGKFVNLALPDQDWTENSIHLDAAGYEKSGRILASALGLPETEIASEVLSLIQKKNKLFFHRWRPQNFTYLFGFRKHEQGQNAKEIAEFDPLVAELEAKIHELTIKAQ